MPELRRHPVLLGLAGTVVSLVAAVGAAAAWSAATDHDYRPDATIELTDDQADSTPLVAEDLDGKSAPTTAYELLGRSGLASLRDHRGTPVVVNFFSATCVPCVTEMPAFERVHRAVGDRVDFVGLAVRDGAKEAQGIVARTGVTYETGRDPAGTIASQFGVINMPSTFLVSAEGRIVASHPGALGAKELRRMIDRELLT